MFTSLTQDDIAAQTHRRVQTPPPPPTPQIAFLTYENEESSQPIMQLSDNDEMWLRRLCELGGIEMQVTRRNVPAEALPPPRKSKHDPPPVGIHMAQICDRRVELGRETAFMNEVVVLAAKADRTITELNAAKSACLAKQSAPARVTLEDDDPAQAVHAAHAVFKPFGDTLDIKPDVFSGISAAPSSSIPDILFHMPTRDQASLDLRDSIGSISNVARPAPAPAADGFQPASADAFSDTHAYLQAYHQAATQYRVLIHNSTLTALAVPDTFEWTDAIKLINIEKYGFSALVTLQLPVPAYAELERRIHRKRFRNVKHAQTVLNATVKFVREYKFDVSDDDNASLRERLEELYVAAEGGFVTLREIYRELRGMYDRDEIRACISNLGWTVGMREGVWGYLDRAWNTESKQAQSMERAQPGLKRAEPHGGFAFDTSRGEYL